MERAFEESATTVNYRVPQEYVVIIEATNDKEGKKKVGEKLSKCIRLHGEKNKIRQDIQ